MSVDIQPGSVLAGKYRVERLLGEGGMGVVVEATQLGLNRRVALKFLRADTQGTLGEVAQIRFEREAQAAAQLRGEHIAQVYDVGTLEGGEPFIVMEYLQGEDLGDLLERRGRWRLPTPSRTCSVHARPSPRLMHRESSTAI